MCANVQVQQHWSPTWAGSSHVGPFGVAPLVINFELRQLLQVVKGHHLHSEMGPNCLFLYYKRFWGY